MWPRSAQRDARVQTAASAALDWEKVVAIVKRHRIAGLVHDGLSSAKVEPPAAAAEWLNREAGRIVRQALLLASEAIALRRSLGDAGISPVFLKGASLAMLAYQNLGIKHAWDIDVLVEPSEVMRAAKTLGEQGYERVLPPPDADQSRFTAWIEFSREALYRHLGREVSVELHWKADSNSLALKRNGAQRQIQEVALSPGRSLPTFADEELFAYLCLHGAKHGWARLKWLADISAWISTKSTADVERLSESPAGNPVAIAQTLLLCESLLGLALPAELSLRLRRSWRARILTRVGLHAIVHDPAKEIEEQPLGNLTIELSHFLLAENPRYLLREWQSKAIGWRDFNTIYLPKPLYFLYPVIRVPSWLWRRVIKLLR